MLEIASPRLLPGGQVAMTSYTASIFRNRPTSGFIFSKTSSIKKKSPNGEMVASRWIIEARGLSLRSITEDEPILEEDMDRDQMVGIIRRRLNLEDQDWSIIEKNPKFQQLFENAVEAAKHQLVAEVIESQGCHSGHIVGQKLVFDGTGNLLTKENPNRVCAFLMPNLTVLISAFFENLMNGRNPNEVMFNTTGCFDTGPSCGGWGHVVVRMRAELKA